MSTSPLPVTGLLSSTVTLSFLQLRKTKNVAKNAEADSIRVLNFIFKVNKDTNSVEYRPILIMLQFIARFGRTLM